MVKKIIFVVLALGFVLASCNKQGEGEEGGANSAAVDSMSYALGVSLTQGLKNAGVVLNAKEILAGFQDQEAEKAYLDDAGAGAALQMFSMELQMRQGQPVTEESPLNSNMDTVSYALGVDIAAQLLSSGVAVNAKAISRGVEEAYSESGAEFDEATVKAQLDKFSAIMKERSEMLRAEQAVENEAEAIAFLNENKTKEGVQTTASGLQYTVETEGKGPSPAADEVVLVHYEGRLLNGDKFDSSYDRGEPAEFPVGRVIPGWIEALQLMKAGSKWTLFIPPSLAYGAQGTPNIPPNSALIFDVELLEIKPKPAE